MSYNGSGTFQINTSGQPVVTGTIISSIAFNSLTADLATGLSTAITKDGQTATTVRIPFAQGINSTLVTDSTSTTTGSIITAGGLGIAKALNVGTTLAVAGDSTFTGFVNAPNTFGFKNRIINGGMVIDQRNAGASVTPVSGAYTLDRWSYGASQASKFTVQQTPSATETGYATRIAAGFTNYLGATVASAVSVGSGDNFWLQQAIEGLNVSDLAWGTANAKTVTLSFIVRSSLTGTFGGSIMNNAVDRSYPFTYSIPTANTWTTISITITGDTSGTWLTTNGVGIRVYFGLGQGSTSMGTAGAWAGAYATNATGAVSVVGTNGATFYITGVQLEKGSTATSFDFRFYGTELALCQRYLPAITSSGSISTGYNYSSTQSLFTVNFTSTARIAPTGITVTGSYSVLDGIGNPHTVSNIVFSNGGSSSNCEIVATAGGVATVGQGAQLRATAASSILFTGCEL